MTHELKLILDDLDYADVMQEIKLRKDQGRPLPDGESSVDAAHIAEIVRDLWDYREMFDAQRPPAKKADG
jgi:hypothetical protein